MLEILRHQFGPVIGTAAQELTQWQVYAILLVAIVIATSIHVFGHAWMADLLGDRTPRTQKRVSLNPFAHFDLLGLMLMVVTMRLGFPMGWGRPIRTNPQAYRTGPRLGLALVAAAGPAMNFLAALALSGVARGMIDYFLRRGGNVSELFLYALTLVVATILVNLSLFVFNLIPVGPLDAYHVVASMLPPTIGETFRKFMTQWGPYVLVALMYTKAMPEIIGPIIRWLASLLIGVPL